jgi:hypothetical protein
MRTNSSLAISFAFWSKNLKKELEQSTEEPTGRKHTHCNSCLWLNASTVVPPLKLASKTSLKLCLKRCPDSRCTHTKFPLFFKIAPNNRMSKAAIESNTGRHASMVQDAQKLRDQVPAMQRDVQIRADLQNLGQCRFVPVPCLALTCSCSFIWSPRSWVKWLQLSWNPEVAPADQRCRALKLLAVLPPLCSIRKHRAAPAVFHT